jgi:Leucine-rich repeat (LRR) protein
MWVWFGSGGAAVLLVVLLIVLLSGGKDKLGTVAIDTPDPTASLILTGSEGETTFDPAANSSLELKPGTYSVRLASATPTLELVTKEITIESGGRATITLRRPGAINPPLASDDVWLKQTTSLPPEQQLDAVIAELKRRNPAFDGKTQPPKKTGQTLTGLTFSADHITDLFPLRALPTLRELDCSGSKAGVSKLADLSRIAPLRLTSLKVNMTNVADLSPLRDMPLQTVNIRQTQVENLEPLRGKKLVTLDCSMTKVRDLSPLQGMSLRTLTLQSTQVTNLKPIEGMPLTRVTITASKIADLTPLARSPIDTLTLTWTTAKEVEPLRNLKTLKTVNGKPVDQFWKEVAMKK